MRSTWTIALPPTLMISYSYLMGGAPNPVHLKSISGPSLFRSTPSMNRQLSSSAICPPGTAFPTLSSPYFPPKALALGTNRVLIFAMMSPTPFLSFMDKYIEMNHVFQNLDKFEDDHASLLSLANQRLHENKSTSLISDIRLCDRTSKLRNYKCFKITLGLIPYLFRLKNQKMATTLSRFRLSSHPLEIELGRHT